MGTAIFDTSEKRRAPAWCDRVLWRVQDESKLEPKPEPTGQCLSRITPIWYGRHELTTSDHRPIGAALTVAVAVAVAERRRAVHAEIPNPNPYPHPHPAPNPNPNANPKP